MLTKTSAYIEIYDRQTKWMCFYIKYDDLLEKYNATWDNVCANTTNNMIAAYLQSISEKQNKITW